MEKLIFKRSTYENGDTAIIAMTENNEFWCNMSVNLEGYGMHPTNENYIFIPSYKISPETYNQFEELLVERIENPVVFIGYSTGIEVKLKDNWKEICEEI